MIKKIRILGMELDNYTVREEMLRVEEFLNSIVLNTIENISTRLLVVAEHDPNVRQCIEEADLAIVTEKGILTTAGINSAQRIQETKENEFFKEFMKRITRNRKSVYILGASRHKVDELHELLADRYEGMSIVGEYATEECVGNLDAVINELNSLAPDIIISILPVPQQESFLMENKDKMNARIWYGMGEEYVKYIAGSNIFSMIINVIHKKSLQSKNNKYKKK